ncbi:MAG: hypothetical protein WCF04_08105, partial [Candidatus Nanopelagicales bacterium]
VRIARSRAALAADAPVLPALHIPPLARLGRARNSDDPRAALGTALPGLADLAAELGVVDSVAMRMPPIRLR